MGRRAFVRAASGLLASAAVGDACREIGSPGSGTIRVTINGLLPGGDTAGTATVTGGTLPAPLIVPLPPLTFKEITVDIGTYHVVYEAPPGYTVVPGAGYTIDAQGRAELDVVVEDQKITPVEITISTATGTLRITVTGLQGAATGGSASVVRTDITGQTPVTVNVPASGTVDTAFAAGTYSVTYSPPGGHALAPGETNPRSVTVTAGQVVTATYQVQQGGTVRVTVTGIDAGAANGGSASVLRTDIGGQTPVTVNVPVTGTVDTGVAPGTYSVTYTPPGGRRLVAGQTNPQSVIVASGGLGTATFQIEVIPGPSGILFHSDWSTALGTGNAAIFDSSKSGPWLGKIGTPPNLEVIPSTGLDFPTANVLRVTALNSQAGMLIISGLSVPAIGESRFWRWYFRPTFPDGLEDPETHPVQDDLSGLRNWEFAVYHNVGGNGFWRPSLLMNAGANTPQTYKWDLREALPKGVTHRWELQVQRTGLATCQIHIRIFSSAGAPLYSDVDFRNSVNSSVTLATNPNLGLVDADAIGGLWFGLNGIAGANPPFPFVYCYHGAVALSASDWCGPYAGGI
jgi:hypothetical protein